MSENYTGTDFLNQPLRDAWWTPGWTSQNQSYIVVPPNQFQELGFPTGVTYASVTASLFDADGNPVSGYYTFWPSSALTFNVDGAVTYMPQRFVGTNESFVGINQLGSGKVYLWYGRLRVALMCTDNANMAPASFSYHVKEHLFEGRQYDILVPSADAGTPMDINSLIVPGSIRPLNAKFRLDEQPTIIQYAAVSTQYVSVDITAAAGGMGINPTSFPVNFAFIAGPTEPQDSDWIAGSWASINSPYVAQILVGPGAGGLNLAKATYQIWVQVDAAPQVPVIQIGTLVIY
jgi:hypothetical protein